MKLVPHELLMAREHGAFSACLQLAVAHLQGAALCRERQDARHGMAIALQICELLAQQQHAATFGVHGPVGYKLPERSQAAVARTQLSSVLFGESSRKDEPPRLLGDRLIVQRAPAHDRHPVSLEEFRRFGVSEMEGCIAGNGNRQFSGVVGNPIPKRVRPWLRRFQERCQILHVEMLFG